MPLYINPAEFLLDITSSDFAGSHEEVQQNLDMIHTDWKESQEAAALNAAIPEGIQETKDISAHWSPTTGHATVSFFRCFFFHLRSRLERQVISQGDHTSEACRAPRVLPVNGKADLRIDSSISTLLPHYYTDHSLRAIVMWLLTVFASPCMLAWQS